VQAKNLSCSVILCPKSLCALEELLRQRMIGIGEFGLARRTARRCSPKIPVASSAWRFAFTALDQLQHDRGNISVDRAIIVDFSRNNFDSFTMFFDQRERIFASALVSVVPPFARFLFVLISKSSRYLSVMRIIVWLDAEILQVRRFTRMQANNVIVIFHLQIFRQIALARSAPLTRRRGDRVTVQ
jgi:hypothetical protein